MSGTQITTASQAATQAPCGCCDGISLQTPVLVTNRPGLSQVAYRVGRHSSFKASLLASLSNPAYSPMGLLATRDDSDFTIALLDAFAVAADILTFYQERLANESYLRTASLQRSVFELAGLVGYRPSPGVAATAALAVTLNDAPGAPDPALIPAATRVQSVPGLGQNAVIFETAADLKARIEHNALPAQTTVPVDFSQVTSFLWLEGTATSLKVGDALLLVDQARAAGDASGVWAWRTLTAVRPDAVAGRTLVQWSGALVTRELQARTPSGAGGGRGFGRGGGHGRRVPPVWVYLPIFQAGSQVSVYALRRRASLFGVTAIDPNMLPSTVVTNIRGYQPLFSPGFGIGLVEIGGILQTSLPDWNFSVTMASQNQVVLDQLYTLAAGATPAAGSDPSQLAWTVLSGSGTDQLYAVTGVDETSPLAFGLSSKATRLTLDATTGVADWVNATRSVIALVQSELLAVVPQPLLAAGDIPAAQAWMLEPVSGSQLTVVGGAQIVAGQAVAVSGRRVRLQLGPQANAQFTGADSAVPLVPAPGDVFLLDAPPDPNNPNSFAVLTLNGVAGTLTVDPATVTLVPSVAGGSAGAGDPIVSEIATLTPGPPAINGTLTTLTFAAPLTHIYDRGTLAVNANVVTATQGQTVNEILGGGNATVAGQTFQLKQAPLTFVPSASGQGAQSTLSVFVNDLLWQEQANLLSSGPADRVYVTRTAQSGSVRVQFGDGATGARPPTGQINIRAQYRVGIGSDGMVQAGQLSQAVDRPPGLRSVANPAPASGGADPDSAADARLSAPLHTLTLDQVVSLTDYRDFAQAFAGVAKASATWSWFGQMRGVAVTVAGAGGSSLAGGSTLTNLTAALRSAGDPYVPVQVLPCQIARFTIGGAVKVATPTYDPSVVLPAVGAALQAAFGFGARSIGQGVAQSEVVAAIQSVPGVTAVRLTQFAGPGAGSAPTDGDGLPVFLPAPAAPPGLRTGPVPGGVLLLDVASLANLAIWQ